MLEIYINNIHEIYFSLPHVMELKGEDGEIRFKFKDGNKSFTKFSGILTLFVPNNSDTKHVGGDNS